MSSPEQEAPPGTTPENPHIRSRLSSKQATELNPSLELSEQDRELAEATRERQVVLGVVYINFSGSYEQGQLVADKAVAQDIKALFAELLARKFPIAGVRPIPAYAWDDDASMENNNSSSVNFRFVGGSDKLSLHSFGIAIDINPAQNPMVIGDERYPSGAMYDERGATPGTITKDIVDLFAQHGFEWGGNWQSLKDYQHFQIAPDTLRNRALKKLEQNPRDEAVLSEVAYWQKIVDLQSAERISQ